MNPSQYQPKLGLAALQSELVRPPEPPPHHPFYQTFVQGMYPSQHKLKIDLAALQSEFVRPPENHPQHPSSQPCMQGINPAQCQSQVDSAVLLPKGVQPPQLPQNLSRRPSSSQICINDFERLSISPSISRSVEDYKQYVHYFNVKRGSPELLMLFYSIYRFLLDLNEARHSKDTISTTDGAALRNRGNRFIKKLEASPEPLLIRSLLNYIILQMELAALDPHHPNPHPFPSENRTHYFR